MMKTKFTVTSCDDEFVTLASVKQTMIDAAVASDNVELKAALDRLDVPGRRVLKEERALFYRNKLVKFVQAFSPSTTFVYNTNGKFKVAGKTFGGVVVKRLVVKGATSEEPDYF